MIKIYLFCLTVVFVGTGFSQNDTTDAYFIVLYTIGENWDTTKSAYDQNYMKEHSFHLGEMRKEQRIVTGGRYSDTGMIIIKAKDEEEARTIILKDLAIIHNTFRAEVHPYKPFYGGCIE